MAQALVRFNGGEKLDTIPFYTRFTVTNDIRRNTYGCAPTIVIEENLASSYATFDQEGRRNPRAAYRRQLEQMAGTRRLGNRLEG